MSGNSDEYLHNNSGLVVFIAATFAVAGYNLDSHKEMRTLLEAGKNKQTAVEFFQMLSNYGQLM